MAVMLMHERTVFHSKSTGMVFLTRRELSQLEKKKEKKSKNPPAHYHGEAARNVTANVRMADDSIDSYHYHN